VDWAAVAALAERHGVAATVHAHLHGRLRDSAPAEALQRLRRAARAGVAGNLRLRHELGRLLGALEAAGIPAMPLKGPVLADRLYPTPWLRHTGDLDVLVPRRDVEAAGRVLGRLGYARSAEAEQGADYHTIYTTDAGAVIVELHVGLGERHLSGLDVADVWRSAVRARWQQHPIWTMALPDLLVYLAFHAAKDGLASLRHLVDIALLVERHGAELPWAAMAVHVRAARLRTPVYLSLTQARDLLGAELPDRFLDAIRPRRLGWRVAQRLFRRRGGVLHARDELLSGPFMTALTLLWEDDARARWRQIRRNLLPSARLRARWLPRPASAPWIVWYPAWIGHAIRHTVRQLSVR
jgi:hypothetical protein